MSFINTPPTKDLIITKYSSNSMIAKTVTRNNQVTIPKKLCEKYGIREGSPVYFGEENGAIVIRKSDPSFWDNVPRCLPDNFEEMLEEWRNASDKRMEELLKRYERPA